jgi:hypothetical protein
LSGSVVVELVGVEDEPPPASRVVLDDEPPPERDVEEPLVEPWERPTPDAKTAAATMTRTTAPAPRRRGPERAERWCLLTIALRLTSHRMISPCLISPCLISPCLISPRLIYHGWLVTEVPGLRSKTAKKSFVAG